jgi:multimeric flavodoxin WrbA
LNILIFFGSPHKDGITAKMVDDSLKEFQRMTCVNKQLFHESLCTKGAEHHAPFIDGLSKSINVNIIDAYQSNIAPCIDCGYCKNNVGCSFRDFQNIVKLIQDADCIIIATPVYYLSIPAPLKAIFDRFQQFYSVRFIRGIKPVMQKSKIGGLIVCSGSQKTDGVDIIRKQVKMAFGLINCKLIAETVIIGTDSEVNDEDISHKASEFTNNIINAYSK